MEEVEEKRAKQRETGRPKGKKQVGLQKINSHWAHINCSVGLKEKENKNIKGPRKSNGIYTHVTGRPWPIVHVIDISSSPTLSCSIAYKLIRWFTLNQHETQSKMLVFETPTTPTYSNLTNLLKIYNPRQTLLLLLLHILPSYLLC